MKKINPKCFISKVNICDSRKNQIPKMHLKNSKNFAVGFLHSKLKIEKKPFDMIGDTEH